MDAPGEIRYAESSDLRIVYQTFGAGDIDLVVVPGFISNLDLIWDIPAFAGMLRRLGRFARCVMLDKRGTGLSDRSLGFGSMEERMDDIRAVMDAVGLERAALFGYSEGGPLSLLFAATYPERATALAIYGSMARILDAPDYPSGFSEEDGDEFVQRVERDWGTGDAMYDRSPFIQHIPDTDATRSLLARYERGACTPTMAANILRCNIAMDVHSALPAVSAPTLVVHSDGDPLLPVLHGRYLGNNIPGARYVETEGDFHMTWYPEDAAFLDEIEAFLTGERHAVADIDRVLATMLFTDIVSSTEQAAELGDARWRELLDRHDELAGREVERHRGIVVKSTGDGLLARFDGPARAVACAGVIRDEVAGLGLRTRAGAHTGEVELRGDDVAGIAVHIASRVADLAGPGEVLVSRTVKDLVTGSGLAFEERGEHVLKGVPDRWHLYAATS